jgi:hypothetical protein
LAGVTRVVHPANGIFDVIVVQSSSAEAFPESAGVLSGSPVYTAYLQVGAPVEWILQYCVPRDRRQEQAQYVSVVRLSRPAPVTAPYPKLTVLPAGSELPTRSRMTVHGFLDARGHFRKLRVVGRAESEKAASILSHLEDWEFRPGLRDGAPIRLEILLVIPPLPAEHALWLAGQRRDPS